MTEAQWITLGLVLASVGQFAICLWSARTLMGWTAACGMVALAVPIGWFAEQMGSSRGWFFGRFRLTQPPGGPVDHRRTLGGPRRCSSRGQEQQSCRRLTWR